MKVKGLTDTVKCVGGTEYKRDRETGGRKRTEGGKEKKKRKKENPGRITCGRYMVCDKIRNPLFGLFLGMGHLECDITSGDGFRGRPLSEGDCEESRSDPSVVEEVSRKGLGGRLEGQAPSTRETQG